MNEEQYLNVMRFTDQQKAALAVFDKAIEMEKQLSTYDEATRDLPYKPQEQAIEASNQAFDEALKVGWNWEEADMPDGTPFEMWCIKANSTELLKQGRELFVAWCEKNQTAPKTD